MSVCVRTDKAAALERPDGLREPGWESRGIKSMVLTLHGEDHALADVRAHAVGRLAEVEAAVFFQDVSDEQRAVVHDLDAACQRHGVVLLRVPDASWTREERRRGEEEEVL